MRRWFRRLPIRQKLVVMILATSGVVVSLASVTHFVNDFRLARQFAVEELSAQAQLIVESANAALAFQDLRVANQTLGSLDAINGVRIACLYDQDQRLFAEYRRVADARPCEPAAPADHRLVDARRLSVVTSVWEDGKRMGTVHVRSDLAVVERRLRDQALILTAVLLVALGVATLLSAWLQALLSAPIGALVRTASAVSSHGDYSIRVERTSEDELGVLVDAFNRMLDRIQTREEELSRANADLRREIVERRRAEHERAEMLVREREANRLKDEFLATLSHELRTPLNAILGWTRLLRGKALPASGIDAALEKVERNAQMQARLVEDLLEVSRITSGKLRLDTRPLDLVALVNTSIESIRPTAEARGVTIEREFTLPTMPSAGDPDRLQQVIWNLLSNAVKFTPSGGRVKISLDRQRDTDVLTVADTGLGIEPSFLPSVFDTFRQADASATRSHGGLGLGLAIVRHLVEVHGGTVTAASEGRDRGATFTVTLPVRTALPAEAPAAGERHEDPVRGDLLRGYSIVVVDDEPDTRELLQSALEAAGAEVRPAASADEALVLCRAQTPDAIVSDIAMPGRDGYSLMRDLRAPAGPTRPRVAVALSAYAAPRDRERSAEAGFHTHIAKPVDPGELVHAIHALLAEGSVSASETG